MEENYKLRKIRSEAEGELGAGFSITYNTGYSATGDNIAELKAFMARESGRPEVVLIDCGKSWKGTRFYLTLRDSFFTCRYNIKDKRRDVEYYSNSIASLLRGSEPDHPWLHLKRFSAFISMSFSLAMFLLISIISIHVFPSLAALMAAPVSLMDVEIALVIFAMFIFGALTTNAFQRFYDRTFPKCQFEYGPEWRRQRSRRAILLLLITAIVLPTVLPLVLPNANEAPTEVKLRRR